MKFSIPILIAGLLLGSVVKAQDKYTIKGHISGLKDGTVISLYEDNGSVLSGIATDTVKSDNFSFSGITERKTALMIMGNGDGFPSQWLEVWVAPSTIVRISGRGKLLKTWSVESGIPEQKEITRYTLAAKPYLDSIQTLSASVNSLFMKMDKAGEEEKKIIRRSIDSLRGVTDRFQALVNKTDMDILQHTPVTAIWMDKLKDLAIDVKYNEKSSLREPVLKLFSKLNAEQKVSETGRQINNYLFPPTVVKTGGPMADTVFMDLEGKEHRLADYKGKHILLDFWSFGCGPCIMAMPELKEISENLKDKLTVISLSVDTKKKIWQEASEKEKITWVNLNDGGGMTGIAARYGVEGIPYYVIISPEGVILDSWVGYSKGLIGEKVKKAL